MCFIDSTNPVQLCLPNAYVFEERGEGGKILKELPQDSSEPEFVNVMGAQESILRNRFRQPMYPGGLVQRLGLSYRPAELHWLAELIPGLLKNLQIRAQDTLEGMPISV
jgi:hypothetical protein